ncbi:MAG: mevalonate kinase [Chloroflexi bacterium]|nr:mevalonate kinase [Chloroflexota bacterium]
MRKLERSACAKIILCGEHAVVYGRPAIALPLSQLRAHAHIAAHREPFEIFAADLGETLSLTTAPVAPLVRIAQLACEKLGITPPDARLELRSDIPLGANLGSGAAVSIAVARALGAWAGYEFTPDEVSALAYEIEKLHHGTPSGIDNTTIAWEQPVYFVRGRTPELLSGVYVAALPIVIADTGRSTPTHVPVGEVRRAWESAPAHFERIFDAIAVCVHEARLALEVGDLPRLGAALNVNHELLQSLSVSSPELDALCAAARAAGALGAKMSGGGRGGNMLAIARDVAHAQHIAAVLRRAGAARVFHAK